VLNGNPPEPELKVLISLTYPLERDVLTRALAIARPRWNVLQIAPRELHAALHAWEPDVVISSTSHPPTQSTAASWIVLENGAPDQRLIHPNGHHRERRSLDLTAILNFVDSVANP
jgi:hypothetical protein